MSPSIGFAAYNATCMPATRLPLSAACYRSLLGGIGMGSVSDYCVQHLLCPVLVVKQGPEAEKQQQT